MVLADRDEFYSHRTCCFSFFGNFASGFILCVFGGIGSSILHPEASRLTSLASGGKRGLAQSDFSGRWEYGKFIRPVTCCVVYSALWTA